ncbi:transcriptional regulator [Candidatus Chloroploca sp. Khr17]|uniref:P-II family nitrogen regulator n=1 Tax=Candidatus Chloroploca sp. Khr17 TaxID=2496869 RepID=UPI00101C2A06|nr:transcriptional regulator [Candidatus Chloroploca sp. Khr17]
MSQLATITLVTIIAEGVLRERLLGELAQLGARGYTVGEVTGQGTSGVSANFWAGHQVRIEVLAMPAVADLIMDHLQAHYFDTYSVVAYLSEVRVARAEKYL